MKGTTSARTICVCRVRSLKGIVSGKALLKQSDPLPILGEHVYKDRGFPDFAAMPAALFAAALVCAFFALSPTASAVGASKPLKIVAPGNGALVKGGSVRLEVSASPSLSSFRARLGNKDVTAAFHRDGQLRFATLHLGKALKRGANYLYVRARLASGREAFAYRSFFVVKRSRDLLSGGSITKGSGAAPVVASTRSSPTGVVLKGKLNGRPVSAAFVRRSSRHRAELGADDGLRFGRNNLHLLAYSGGRYDVVHRTFVIPRDRPIPGAGPNRQARRGAAIALSGKSSRAARKGASLSYRWQVVAAPNGAKPKLRGANTSTPSLWPNGSGTYRVRLTVTERPPGATSSARTVRDSGATASEQDVVTIAVQPDDPPIGARIETLTGAGKINIAGADVPGTGTGQLSYAVLDRATREVLASSSVAATPAGMQAVEKAFENRQERRCMVIVSSNKGVDPTALPALQELLTALGASPLGPRDRRQILFSEGEPYAFSAIGYPGSPPGSAFVNVGRRRFPRPAPGTSPATCS